MQKDEIKIKSKIFFPTAQWLLYHPVVSFMQDFWEKLLRLTDTAYAVLIYERKKLKHWPSVGPTGLKYYGSSSHGDAFS
jgi:hypothetical protein